MKGRNIGITALLGLVLAAVGVIAPILWDQYKTKSALELQHLSNVTLVQGSGELEKLQIMYDGKPIQSVSKVQFALVNVGRTPIRSTDLIENPKIVFSQGTTILDFKVDAVAPGNLRFDKIIDSEKGIVELNFPLLNPSDYIQFGIIISGKDPQYTAEARIVGINQLTIVDRRQDLAEKPQRDSWSLLIVGLFTFISLFLLLFASMDVVSDVRARWRRRRGTLFPPKDVSKESYVEFFNRLFSYKTPVETLQVRHLIGKLPDNQLIEDQSRIELDDAVNRMLNKVDVTYIIVMIALPLSMLGTWYVVSSLF